MRPHFLFNALNAVTVLARRGDADAAAGMLPHLLVQPLVENAVKHGVSAHVAPGTVTVRAWRNGDVLHVTVEDDGPGPTAAASQSNGIGLANTRARLGTLYGERAPLALERQRDGGAIAHIDLPFTE